MSGGRYATNSTGKAKGGGMPPQRSNMSSTPAAGSLRAGPHTGSLTTPASTQPGAQAPRHLLDDSTDVAFRAEAAPANGTTPDRSGFTAPMEVRQSLT